MNLLTPRSGLLVAWLVGLSTPLSASDASARPSPQPRPRLTEALRAQVESNAPASQSPVAVTMDRVIVRDSRLPAGPSKHQPAEGKFSLTQGGYFMKNRGERFSTEVGLWRHIDIMDDPAVALRQSPRIRMGILRFSW